MVDIGIEFMVGTFVTGADVVVGQSAGIVERAVAGVAACSSIVANNAQVQGIAVFFSIKTEGSQFVLQLAVIVAVGCRQIAAAGIHEWRTAVDAEGFRSAHGVQNVVEAAQGIIHQAVADA